MTGSCWVSATWLVLKLCQSPYYRFHKIHASSCLCLNLFYFINIEVNETSVLAYEVLSIGAGGQNYRVSPPPPLPLLDLIILE